MVGIWELLLLAGMAVGGAGAVQAQPLVWLGGNLVRAAGPASALVLAARAKQPMSAVVGGPVGVLPTPTAVPPRFAPPPPPSPPKTR